MTTTELIALLQSKELGGATGRPRDINIYIRNGDGSETWVMDNDSHFIVTGAGDGMLGTDIDLTIINSRTLKEEAPTDRFAMGTPTVAHAGENELDIEARQIALQLVIHQGLSFEDAYKKAYQFILYEYDKDAHQIREMHQTCFVRYTVEIHTNHYVRSRAEVHIACTDISGFQVMHLKTKDLSAIPSLVEEQARKQIDELLYSSKQKAGRISVKEVDNFNGEF